MSAARSTGSTLNRDYKFFVKGLAAEVIGPLLFHCGPVDRFAYKRFHLSAEGRDIPSAERIL